MPTEPAFIQAARQAIEQEAIGRPDAATYAEAGNAALNMVLAHYLATPLLNPGLVVDGRLAHQRQHYERLLQQATNLLAHERQTVAQLHQATTDRETGLPCAEALRRTRDQVLSARYTQKVAEEALQSGLPPVYNKAGKARHERAVAENLRLATRVREPEAQLATRQQEGRDQLR